MQQTLATIWSIVEPVVTLFAGIIVPIVFVWLSRKLETWLSIKTVDQQADFEAKLRDALHKSAETALKLVLVKAGATGAITASAVTDLLNASPTAMPSAVASVKTKNPDAVQFLGVSDDSIRDIIISKIPEIVALLLAARK